MSETPIVGEEGDATFERIRNLENEVATTREALQQTIEELETSNEELQSLNEELQSTNEELQATNEELETSNEELQSTNEELITVNEELQVTASELSGRTGELISVLESTPLAIVVADSALQITQATLAATRMFNIRRPISSPHISQCALPEGFPILAPICSEALRLGQTVTEEFTSKGTRIRLTCSPYFDVNGQILGVTMVVSEFPGMAHEMEMILDNSKLLLLNRTRGGEILRISEAYAELLGLSRDKALSKNVFSLMKDNDACKEMFGEDDSVLEKPDGFDSELRQVTLADGGEERWINMDHHRFPHHITGESTFFTIGTDVTETVEARERAEGLLRQAEMVQDMVGIGFWSIDSDGQTPYWSPKVYEIHGVKPEEYNPEIDSAIAFFHPDDREDVQRIVSEAIETGSGFTFIKRLIRPDGVEIRVESQGMAIRDDNGEVTRLVGIFREAQEADS
ncbi:PAS domain S-box protein [Phaeobacter sp. BS23]